MTSKATAEIMGGTDLARRLVEGAAERAQHVRARLGRPPCLAAVLVGRDPASVTYVNMKRSRARRAGVESRLFELPEQATTAEVAGLVGALSADDSVDGILLQHPVPPQVDERASFEAITPAKDVDGVTMRSFAAMAFGLSGFASCTPSAIIRLLDHYGVDPTGQRAVVIGRSPILGKPVGMLLLARDATVTYCHARTRGLEQVAATADILVAAVGKPRFVRADWIKPGAVVIDAGYNEGDVGDVDFEEATTVARLVTPVPGGVGPVTVAVLIDHTVRAAEARAR